MGADRYDVIVIGAGIAGLATAALAARRGLRPLVLEQADAPGGACAAVVRERYRFDAGVGLLWGFEERGSLRGLLEEVGATVEPLALDPGFQVALPRHRIGFFRRDDRFWRELRREVGDGEVAARAFFTEVQALDDVLGALDLGPHDLPPRTAWSRFRQWRRRSPEVGEFLARAKEPLADLPAWQALPPPLQRGVALILRHLAHADPASPLLAAATVVAATRRGFAALRGGASALGDALARAVERQGGTVRTRTRATEILLRGRRAAGVRTAEGQALEAPRVVAAVPPATLVGTLVPGEGRVLAEPPPSPETATLTLYLGVDEAILPMELGTHLFLDLPSPREPWGIRSLSVSTSPAWDGGRAPQGRRAVTVNAFIAPSDGEPPGGDWLPVGEAVLAILEDFMPGLRGRLDYCEFRTPLAWQEHTGRPRGAAGYPLASLPAFLAWHGHPHATGIGNLYVAGDWTFPGCSVAAVAQGARRTVDLILARRR